MTLLAISSLEAVGWLSFVFGLLILLTGVVSGLIVWLKVDPSAAKQKITDAKAKIDETKLHLAAASKATPAAPAAEAASTQGAATAESAKSTLDDLTSMLGSLPLNLRFPGLLIIIGALMVGVATSSFAHVSLF